MASDILLANGKVAVYKSTRVARVPDYDPDNDATVHTYEVPCPLCEHMNTAHSYDGVFFATNQISCRLCGVFYRPVVSPDFVRRVRSETN